VSTASAGRASPGYDLAVVGAGIVGLGVALAAARQRRKVVVIDRGSRATGASVRNFGLVSVSGQRAGAHWARARRSREVWAEIAPRAGIAVLQRGLLLPAYRAEAADVLHAFGASAMGAECRLLGRDEARRLAPMLRLDGLREVLYSPHELRVESRQALPQLARWLAAAHGVEFRWNSAALAVDDGGVATAAGRIAAAAVVVCPGDDFATLYPERLAAAALQVCTLQMLRLDGAGLPALDCVLMSDHTLARYAGFAGLAEAAALQRRLDREAPALRAAGVHAIAVQSADRSLVVGDSHAYGDAVQPFARAEVDAMILHALGEMLELGAQPVIERWIGSYAYSPQHDVLLERPAPNVRLVLVTGGSGASTAFALGEQVVADLDAAGSS
jgi:FAD dependent oxidoreductase TIGR03364